MSDVRAARDAGDATSTTVEETDASEAFAALGDENRLAAIRALSEADEPLSFSALFEAAPADTTAGFAYHLRQLVGVYLRRTDDEETYTLTAAGRRAARAVRAGLYAEGPDVVPTEPTEPCPHCGERALDATVEDGVVTVACTACETPVCSLSCPPGAQSVPPEEALAAVDRHHRHRLATMADGACPECGGHVDRSVEPVQDGPDSDVDDATGDDPAARARGVLACASCGWEIRCPVTLAVLEHPSVVAFYHDHDIDLADRPLWNVGREWRERVLSIDPVCVRVSAVLDDDLLELFVDRDLDVVDARRTALD